MKTLLFFLPVLPLLLCSCSTLKSDTCCENEADFGVTLPYDAINGEVLGQLLQLETYAELFIDYNGEGGGLIITYDHDAFDKLKAELTSRFGEAKINESGVKVMAWHLGQYRLALMLAHHDDLGITQIILLPLQEMKLTPEMVLEMTRE